MKAYLRDPKTVKKEITDCGHFDVYAMFDLYKAYKGKSICFKPHFQYKNWFNFEDESKFGFYNWHISWLKPVEENAQLLLDFG